MNLGKQTTPTDEVSSYIAYVTIPNGIDRNVFIRHCYSTYTIFVSSVDAQKENNVMVDKLTMSQIIFPKTAEGVGSSVLCVIDPIYGNSKVVGVFKEHNEESIVTEENQFRVSRSKEETFFDFDLKGNTGEMNLTLNSGGFDNISSNIRLLNSSNKAKLNVEVQGDLNVVIDNTLNFDLQKGLNMKLEDIDNNKGKITTIKYLPETGLEIKDEFDNSLILNKEGFKVNTKDGSEFEMKDSFVFKNSSADLKDILDDVFTALSTAVITTPVGPGSFTPSVIQVLEQNKEKLKQLMK